MAYTLGRFVALLSGLVVWNYGASLLCRETEKKNLEKTEGEWKSKGTILYTIHVPIV